MFVYMNYICVYKYCEKKSFMTTTRRPPAQSSGKKNNMKEKKKFIKMLDKLSHLFIIAIHPFLLSHSKYIIMLLIFYIE